MIPEPQATREPAYDIRLARADELPEAGDVTMRGYIHDGLLHNSDPYAERLRDAAARAEDSEVWVAVDDGGVLGCVTFCPAGSSYRELARDDEAEFRMLAVDPPARGRGVGRALVDQCVRRARELGFGAVVISSSQEMTSAWRIYAAAGFTHDPGLDWSPVPGVDLLGFRLVL